MNKNNGGAGGGGRFSGKFHLCSKIGQNRDEYWELAKNSQKRPNIKPKIAYIVHFGDPCLDLEIISVYIFIFQFIHMFQY